MWQGRTRSYHKLQNQDEGKVAAWWEEDAVGHQATEVKFANEGRSREQSGKKELSAPYIWFCLVLRLYIKGIVRLDLVCVLAVF